MKPKVRYQILFVLCAMYFISYIDRVNISVAAPIIRKELGLTPTQLGLIFSSFAYPYAATQIYGGWLADRYGPRLILTILSTIWAAATILTGLAGSVASLVLCRLLVGIGEGGAFPTATRAFTFWTPVRERGRARGLAQGSSRLGGALTPPIVLFIVASYGWRASFVVLGAVSFVWTIVWIAFFRNSPAEHPSIGAEELAEIGALVPVTPGGKQLKTPWRQLVSRMWLVTVVDFCYGWSLWVFLTWLPSYLSDARHFPLSQMALMTMLPLMGGVVGDLVGGFASDVIYNKTGNLRLARRAVLVVGLAGAFLFILPAVMTQSAVSAVWYLALAFFFLEITNPVLWTLPLDIAPRYSGSAGGMMNTGFGVAGMISPLVFGFLIERTGSYQLPFFLSAGLLLIGAVCAMKIDPLKRVEEPAPLPAPLAHA
jgi:ACS family D-galactonate transporter-like MFS transporter